jgi:hypothetical protein
VLGQIDLDGLVPEIEFVKDDVRSLGAGAWRVVKLHERNLLVVEDERPRDAEYC